MFGGMDAVEEQLPDEGQRSGKKRRTRVGPYVLMEPLGRGGMGHVYKAEHRLMKRVVALKLAGRLRRDGDDAALVNRFRREVEAAGRVRHPSIVLAYDAGVWRGRLYLAMEYVQGIDLERLVADTGPLSVDLACEIMRQTAEALHHAHQRGLVHRDIKPSNLMLAPPGVTVKLLDLGLAQLANLSSSDNQDGELCGTPDFMAPEWGHDPQSADARGDLYSLGCTFYFLLTGQVPYPGGSWTDKLLRHSLETPMPVAQLRPDVPLRIAAIVERLMAREAADRYPDAATVAAELAVPFSPSAVSEADNSGKGDRPTQGPRSSPRGRRFSCTAMAAVLLGVAAAGAASRMVAPPPMLPAPEQTTSKLPFTIEGRADGFPSLAKAVAAAKEGDAIIIHGSGPHQSPPLSWGGKALTLRAAPGTRPRLTMTATEDPWQAFLQTDRALTLEGLELAVDETAAGNRTPAVPLIRCVHAPLSLQDCRLISTGDGTAIVARHPPQVRMRGCEITAGSVGVSIEVPETGDSRIRLVDTQLNVRQETGAALSLWSLGGRQGSAVEVELEGNTVSAGRLIALRGLQAPLTFAARGNHFFYRAALFSYSGCADPSPWLRTVWQTRDNTFQGPPSRFRVEDRPIPPAQQPQIR